MKSIFVCAAFACLTLALSPTAAFAIGEGEPISGTSVGLEHDPPRLSVGSGVTDGNGRVTFGKLAPGKYVLVIDGLTLVKAMDRLAPSKPARHDSGPTVSLGVGGFFGGGGSHHSSGGAGPVGGESHSGRTGGLAVDPNDPSGNRVNSGGSSTGGVGLGVNVPIGGGGGDAQGGGIYNNAPIISMTLTVSGTPGGNAGTDVRESSFSSETPYCRATAGQGMRLGFSVPEGAGLVIIAISQLAGQPQN